MGVGKYREKQAISSSTAFVGCGELGSVHRQKWAVSGKGMCRAGVEGSGSQDPAHSLTLLPV